MSHRTLHYYLTHCSNIVGQLDSKKIKQHQKKAATGEKGLMSCSLFLEPKVVTCRHTPFYYACPCVHVYALLRAFKEKKRMGKE